MRWTALHDAAWNGYAEKVLRILESQTENINEQDTSKRTPLHWAVWNDHFEICLLLVAFGADLNIQEMYCWTPLDLAKYRMSDVKKPGKTDSRIIDLLKNTNDTLRRILRENRLFYEEAIVSYRQVQWSTFLMGHRNNIHGHVSLLNTDVLEIILRKLVNQLF
eukprot:c7845_g1_i3.p1 GENE.c7845_g1_i3~~c7845_g1_i3.p1  ORF type:complete len:163 (-),score=36.66 c7845_g1_i3:44-532(-)